MQPIVAFAVLATVALSAVAGTSVIVVRNQPSTGCIVGQLDLTTQNLTNMVSLTSPCVDGVAASSQFAIWVSVTLSNGSFALVSVDPKSWTVTQTTLTTYKLQSLHYIFWFGTTHVWGVWYNTAAKCFEAVQWDGFDPAGPTMAGQITGSYRPTVSVSSLCGDATGNPALAVEVFEETSADLYVVAMIAFPVTVTRAPQFTMAASFQYDPQAGPQVTIPMVSDELQPLHGWLYGTLNTTSGQTLDQSKVVIDRTDDLDIWSTTIQQGTLYLLGATRVPSSVNSVIVQLDVSTGKELAGDRVQVPRDVLTIMFTCCQ
eukprot:TRINITY_DN14591_c0_g1_i1.p1 TRINITY_DN14591_c0_g1~~TRINITY_DN14591_c0_g1_i1.p1  ORF type:complete len:316 (-),score=70.32 TRINITY_DN14591_c0_g1_i1:16-963(-)